jgi:2'-phosphotransferase
VQKDEKGRFCLQELDNVWHIRANQGHSISSLDQVEMEPILHHSEIPTVVHGTNRNAWESIRKDGLKKMNRLHIHFATGLLSDPDVKSGMRKSADVFIYIDVESAMRDGIQFYRSANNVVLSSGIDGLIAPGYFSSVTTRDGSTLN